jgi:hypothetical protein
MPNCSEVLVLVANEKTATLCANSEGETRLLRAIDRTPARDADPRTVSTADRHAFACELMLAMGRDLRDHPYDGVIIFADTPMMAELRTVQTSQISRLLIAQIVGTPSAHCQFPGRGAASANMANEGVLQ